jgi:hypothetical protein
MTKIRICHAYSQKIGSTRDEASGKRCAASGGLRFGIARDANLNETSLSNAGEPCSWYTDPVGGHASLTPFTGAVAQVVASMDNSRPYPLELQEFRGTRRYGAAGTRASN